MRNETHNGASNIKHKTVSNKNLIQCKVILLDGTDLSVELSVSVTSCPYFLHNIVIQYVGGHSHDN